MRAWLVAQKGKRQREAIESAELLMTRAAAQRELDAVFDPEDWEVRAVELRLLPRTRRTGGSR
jgi:hypothetical protein